MASKKQPDQDKLDRVIAEAKQAREQRERSYREQALKLYPWVCGRCGREFNHKNLEELTVHHKDHNHDNNPADGSNWELLCIYCHENEHTKLLASSTHIKTEKPASATYKPFADLKGLLKENPSDKKK